MQFHISELARVQEIQLHEAVDMPQIANEMKQVDSISSVDAQMSLSTEGEVYRARGELHASVNYICSRCLGIFLFPLKASVDESFAEDAKQEEFGAHIVSRDVVDLNPYIEQELFLALDYHPLCDADCKGLCPECGVNRNEKSCSCDTLTIDPRLSVLKDLHLEGNSE